MHIIFKKNTINIDISKTTIRIVILVNQIIWEHPFDNVFGNDMVYRLFTGGGQPYAIGFQKLHNQQELNNKGIDLQHAMPDFVFSANGVWALMFDTINPVTMSFNGFQHYQIPGCGGGRVLFNVASIIHEHYTTSNAGAYVFSAAMDTEHTRTTDLIVIYNELLGLNGHKSRLLQSFPGWNCYSDFSVGGRGYVITTQSYH